MNNPVRMPAYGASRSVDTDAGLRAHMLGVFRNMGLGLVITGLVAALVGNTPALAAAIYGTPLKWVAIFAPLAFVFFFSFRIEKMTTSGARMAFYAFAAVMGVSLGSVFLVFTGGSIAPRAQRLAGLADEIAAAGEAGRAELEKINADVQAKIAELKLACDAKLGTAPYEEAQTLQTELASEIATAEQQREERELQVRRQIAREKGELLAHSSSLASPLCGPPER